MVFVDDSQTLRLAFQFVADVLHLSGYVLQKLAVAALYRLFERRRGDFFNSDGQTVNLLPQTLINFLHVVVTLFYLLVALFYFLVAFLFLVQKSHDFYLLLSAIYRFYLGFLRRLRRGFGFGCGFRLFRRRLFGAFFCGFLLGDDRGRTL